VKEVIESILEILQQIDSGEVAPAEEITFPYPIARRLVELAYIALQEEEAVDLEPYFFVRAWSKHSFPAIEFSVA
jgi:hypothetical protein